VHREVNTADCIKSWIEEQRDPDNLTPVQYRTARAQFDHADQEQKTDFKHWFGQEVWPDDLEDAILAAELEDVYVAAWVVDAVGEGTWVADNRWRNILNSFDASGNINSTEVVDTRTSEGRIPEEVFEHAVFLNIIQPLPIKTLSYVSEHEDLKTYLDRGVTEKPIQVLQPESYRYKHGEQRAKMHFKRMMERRAKDAAREDAVSQSGGTKIYLTTERILVKEVSFSKVQVKTWLYPLKVGTYTAENERYTIILDGLGGEIISIQNPSPLLQEQQQTSGRTLIEVDQKHLQRLGWVLGVLVVAWLAALYIW
jgi:hypothetical protein